VRLILVVKNKGEQRALSPIRGYVVQSRLRYGSVITTPL
jgi:hypothetical protein